MVLHFHFGAVGVYEVVVRRERFEHAGEDVGRFGERAPVDRGAIERYQAVGGFFFPQR